MAAEDQLVAQAASAFNFGDVGAALTSGIFIAAMFGGIFIVALIAFGIWRVYTSRVTYNFPVEIYYQEKGMKSPIKKSDKGGIFTNKKTNLKRFYLFKNRVGLNPDNVPFIFNNNGKKIVTLWQTGLKSFRYVMPSISPNPGFVMHVGDEDVNWALAIFKEWKERFSQKTFLEQYGYMILWAITIMGTLFVFFFLAQKFDVIASAAESLSQAANALRDAKLGTIVE